MRLALATLALALLGCRTQPVSLRPDTRSAAVRLGYPDSARLLVLHADDIAMTPGVTRASLDALRATQVSSASILATTPFLDSLRAAIGAGETFDFGVHLTLQSESPAIRWAPVAGRTNAATLTDSSGMLALRMRRDVRIDDVERELDAQIARVRAAGIPLTHLDSHQGTLYFSGEAVFDAWRRVAKRACLPIPVPTRFRDEYPYLAEALADGHVAVNDMLSIGPAVAASDWARFYGDAIRALKPGVTVLIVHLGEDSAAERELFSTHRGWGADWRARDRAVVADSAFMRLLRDENVHLVTWRQLAAVASICPSGK